VSKRILYLLPLILGLIGFVGCIAAIVGTWIVDARVNRVTENLFTAIDNSLVVAQQRIARTQGRVEALKVTSEEIERSVRNWTKSAARERLASRLEIEERAERLASGLEQADDWLELAESSVRLVQHALEAASALGAQVQTEPTDHLLEELTSLRNQLTRAGEQVESMRDRSTEATEQNLPGEGLNRVAQSALRVIATLGSIDSRLENVRERLTEIQHLAQNAKTKLLCWVRTAAIGITLLIGWMAVGQASLCHIGWQGFR